VFDPHDKEIFLKQFGEHLRKLRKEKHLSQEQLADNAGLTLSQIGRIERGTRNPSIYTIKMISEGLKVEVKELLNF